MEVHQRDADVAEISHKLDRLLSVDSEDTEDKMDTYHRLIKEGKNVGKQGDMKAALKFFKLAYKIHQSEKLENRINKIEEHLSELESEEDDDFVDVNGSGLMLFRELYDKLYDYQRDGVSFLYSLQRDGRRGGILADDMGLGKTIQVISFLSGMYDNELAKHTLLVMPTSLITNWTKEFAKWTPGMRVKEFHGTGRERTWNLEKVQRRSGVVITTYTMLLNNWQQLSSYNGREFTWDYMILDEAHKIKSTSTKTAKSASAIPSKNRVLLTGTPVQNNLKEMWALFDFACQGTLLGTAKTFKAEYENPITRAREKDSTPGEKALGSRMSENLMAIIKPYFLRRTKAEVQKSKAKRAQQQEDLDSSVQNPKESSGAVMPTLKRKNDLIVWTYLSPVQEDIYRQFISLDHIKELLMTTKSPLAELNIMKKLCDHPRLFSPAAIAKLGLEESEHGSNGPDGDACSIANVPDETLIAESGKLVFLFALLQRLREVISNGSAPPALTIDGVSPPQNKRLSVLKLNTSSRPGSGLGSGLESFEGNFNLQLEESMTSADQEEVLPETEEEEQKLLSQLQMEGSFDVYKSLNERDASRSLHDVHANGADESLDESTIATKKKRAAVIYDSDEDEDDEGDKSHVNSSFQVLGASTPKSAPSGSTPLRSRKSIGGNTSVASRRSFIMSIIEDMDLQQAGEEEEEEEEEMIIGSSHSELQLEESGREEEEESKEIIGSSHNGLQLEESVGEEEVQGDEEEEEVIGSSHSDLQLEETVGEEEEDEDSEYADAVEDTEQESSSNMEESSGAPELSSDERMDKFTGGEQNGGVAAVEEEEEDFDSLVTRGKVMKSKGKLDDALSFFLRAIDLKPGDPEVQLITIQLYRQLSQSR